MGRVLRTVLTAVTILIAGWLALSGCGSEAAPGPLPNGESADETAREPSEGISDLVPVSLAEGEKLRVVATTSIVADVVEKVGGDRIELRALMPLGVDPHSFEPTPQDVAAVADAHVVFANGAGLEEFLAPLLDSAGATDKAVHVSHSVQLRELEGDAEQVGAGEDQHQPEGADPHTWTDPNNVMAWTRTLEGALSSLDPPNAEAYRANAETFRAALTDLDAWIQEQVAQVPESNRKIVADHATLGYFADHYGFEVVGAVIPGYSTLSEPSARELARLQDAIRDLDVKAVFVGQSANPGLVQRVAEDTGITLVPLYTGSLSGRDGPAGSYLEYMRYNVSQIVTALQ